MNFGMVERLSEQVMGKRNVFHRTKASPELVFRMQQYQVEVATGVRSGSCLVGQALWIQPWRKAQRRILEVGVADSGATGAGNRMMEVAVWTLGRSVRSGKHMTRAVTVCQVRPWWGSSAAQEL